MTHFTKTLMTAAFFAAASMATAQAQTSAPQTETSCETINITVYFAKDDPALTRSAKTALQAYVDNLGACQVSTIETSALSTDGSDTLSADRSNAVITALSDMGIATADTRTNVQSTAFEPAASTARRVTLIMQTLPALTDS